MRAWFTGKTPIVVAIIATLIAYLLKAVPALSQRPIAWERLVQWPELTQLAMLLYLTAALISKIRSGR